MSCQICDEKTPGAIQAKFVMRHNHSQKQKRGLEVASKYCYIMAPGVSSSEDVLVYQTQPDKFLDYMKERLPRKLYEQLCAFLNTPIGETGLLVKSMGTDGGDGHGILVEITSNVIPGSMPGLRASRDETGSHSLITLEEDLPHGELFYGLRRRVKVRGELTNEIVQEHAVKMGWTQKDGQVWTNRIAGLMSFQSRKHLWLLPPAPAAPALPSDEEESRLCEEEIKYFGSIRLGGRLERVRAVREAKREVRESLSI
jgi:hypothetical protein